MNAIDVRVAFESAAAGCFENARDRREGSGADPEEIPGRHEEEDVEQGLAALRSRRIGRARDDRKLGIFRKSRITGRSLAKIKHRPARRLDAPGEQTASAQPDASGIAIRCFRHVQRIAFSTRPVPDPLDERCIINLAGSAE
ncbi:MAG TPA: hypothetical protein VN044_10010 [Verrucomicrobiae bacterium]|jgi:hypothetical protein|nr:hypothetical protein [Verrucomicrobiae bacterium]